MRTITFFLAGFFIIQWAGAVTVVNPPDPMISNPEEYYIENFSTGFGALYPQHPGNGVWRVENGKLMVQGVGSDPSIIAAPESEGRTFQDRSIHCDITVNEFEQSAMIVFGYTRDALDNDYFLCAGIYKGRWGIGYYPNEDTGEFALLKSFDYGTSSDPMFHWTYLNVKNPFVPDPDYPNETDGYGAVYHVRVDISENSVGLFVNNSELPYLKFIYDLIPSGAIGLLAEDSGTTDILFDNFKVTDLARSTPQEIASIPYEQNFDDPESALQNIRFSHRENWRMEVDGSGSGSLIVENLPSRKTAIAAFEGLTLNNNFQIDCTITFLSEHAVVSIFFPLRGLTGYSAGASRIAKMYIRTLSKWDEVSAHSFSNYSWGYLLNSGLQTHVPYDVTLRYENGLIRFFLNGQEVKRWADENDMLPAYLQGTLKQMVGLGCEYQTDDPNNGVRFDNFRVTNLTDEWIPSAKDVDLMAPEFKKSTNSIVDRLIEQYDNDPLSLYQYILNNIEMVPRVYWSGLRRSSDREITFFSNAEGTLWRKTGSSAGQSFALMSFLRSLDIPCRLVAGPITMRARDWNRLYNEEVHASDGTPVDPSVAFYRYKYWVEAMVEGDRVSLFPWLKFYETVNNPTLRLEDVLWAPSSSFPDRIGTWQDNMEEESVCVELIRKMLDPESEFFPKDSNSNLVWGTDQPIPILKNYIRNYLESIGSSYSVDQVGTLRKVQPTRVVSLTDRPAEILNAQPYAVITNIDTMFTTNESLAVCQATFKLRVEDTTGNGYLEQEFSAYDMLNDRITLTFIPYSGVYVEPKLKVEGAPIGVWRNNYPTYGTSHKIECTWYVHNPSTGLWEAKAAQKFRVGDVVNCFMDTGGVSPEMVDERYKRIMPVVNSLGTNSPPSNPTDSEFEPYWGSLLHLVQVKWSGYLNSAIAESEKLFNINHKLFYKPGFTTWNIENTGSSYFMGGLSIDEPSGYSSFNSISLSQDVYPRRSEENYSCFYHIISSSYEHQVFNDVFGSKTAGSTFKYLRQAQQQGGTVREINGYTDFDARRAEVQADLAALETHYGTTLDLYEDFDQFFTDSPYGYAWYPTVSVTDVNVRAVGWLLCAGSDTNGNFYGSNLSAQWIHTRFEPSE